MFEHKSEKLVPLPRFLTRVVLSLLLVLVVLCIALTIGAVGYHELAGLSWIDSVTEYAGCAASLLLPKFIRGYATGE